MQLPVSAAEIHEWAVERTEESETAWMKAVRLWVREVVAPSPWAAAAGLRLKIEPSKAENVVVESR